MTSEIPPLVLQQLMNWMQKIGIPNIDMKLIVTAFTHPSYKGMYPDVEDYERLEFLGDAVLDLVSAEELIRASKSAEGVLTERRKSLVNNDYLAQIYDQLKISKFTRTAVNYVPSTKDKANYIEALFGAIFLDKGYQTSKESWDVIQKKMGKPIIKKSVAPLTTEQQENKEELLIFYRTLKLTAKNAKSMLQELCQKQGLPIPEYVLLDRTGPDHSPVFRVKVTGQLFDQLPRWTRSAIGEGKNKKIAELKAAEKMCDAIFLEYIPTD